MDDQDTIPAEADANHTYQFTTDALASMPGLVPLDAPTEFVFEPMPTGHTSISLEAVESPFMFVPMPSSTDPMQYFTYTEAPDLPVAPVQQPTDGTFSFVPVVTGEFYRPTREARAAGMEIIIEDSEDGVGTEQVRRVKPSAILTARKGVIKTAREPDGHTTFRFVPEGDEEDEYNHPTGFVSTNKQFDFLPVIQGAAMIPKPNSSLEHQLRIVTEVAQASARQTNRGRVDTARPAGRSAKPTPPPQPQVSGFESLLESVLENPITRALSQLTDSVLKSLKVAPDHPVPPPIVIPPTIIEGDEEEEEVAAKLPQGVLEYNGPELLVQAVTDGGGVMMVVAPDGAQLMVDVPANIRTGDWIVVQY